MTSMYGAVSEITFDQPIAFDVTLLALPLNVTTSSEVIDGKSFKTLSKTCLLYTSDAADE